MSLQYFEEKKIFLSKCLFYLFIFLSQYCVPKCLVCIRPEQDLAIVIHLNPSRTLDTLY